MVAALLRVSLSSGLHSTAAFVLGTQVSQVSQGTCPPEQSMLHLLPAQKSAESLGTIEHVDRSGKVPSAATPGSWTGGGTLVRDILGISKEGGRR